MCKEEHEERSSSLVQEEPQPPQIKEERLDLLQRPEEADDGSTLTSAAVKREEDDGMVETEPVFSSTSTEHMKTQADAEDCVKSQPTTDEQLLSSHCYESDITEDSDDWEDAREGPSALNTQQKSQQKQDVEGQQLSLSNKLSQDLESSKETHSMRKNFSCTECGTMFKSKGSLKRHALIHTGEKPFTCTVCGKGFSQSCHLKSHMRTHTGGKNISCTECGKMFNRKDLLKSHTLIHTGEKPFACTVCGNRFVESAHLKKSHEDSYRRKTLCLYSLP